MAFETNYKEWQTLFEKQALAVRKIDNQIQQDAAQMLFDNIVKRTPVGNPRLWNPPYWPQGYVPGNLKASWTIEKEGNEIVIYNSAAYAERIETGWSKQASAGMMRVSLLEWDSLLEKAARKYRK